MDSLFAAPVADVLTRLFDEAQAQDGPLHERFAEVAADPVALADFLAFEANDYKGTYQQLAGYYLNVSAEFGEFLYVCARARRARHVVEFGTSFGVSTIYLAAALRDGGGGRLIGTDLEPSKADRARENLSAAGLSDLVEIRVGDALETLRDDVDDGIDLVLLDGAFSLYLPVLKLLEPRLAPGALVIAENAVEESGEYLTYVRNQRHGYRTVALPFGGERGNQMSVRTI
ncbi:class I SAM-dependent methyltransferase [Candidatus Mycobacterium wuenschmannii]|uniref:Class I SAM-dependent methyltransferase n=1 Tax=Candidatus Mycobacterium wuenschmannii TaxID=3027808 RepID=A0ABY8VS76_9MYCO|nr:class I SAM-dependent methyltransferase [Candidatus Mycobacterium wuenschmannii]WIM85855.1 class I SAM-dependent methyltransferase [Candidatus Mycobacterium wuenschmannii]